MTTTPTGWHTVDSITSDQLDDLQDRLQRAESEIGNMADAAAWLVTSVTKRVEAERDAVYRERAHLVAHLAALYPSHIGATDPDAPDWPVLVVETPTGQMSWHIAPGDIELVGHVRPTAADSPGWDGHTTEEKYGRLRALTAARAAEGSGQ